MELLDFIFRLGVLFAIYGFIWGLIEIAFVLLSAGRKRNLVEVYTIRALKYFFLVDVTFLFCVDSADSMNVITNQLILSGLLLLTYFIGKLQNNQNKQMVFRMVTMSNGMSSTNQQFNIKAEFSIILLSLAVFAGFWFYPELASNPASVWFHESILNIEDTPIFGFIFQIIGFFVILSLIFKMSSSLGYIISGQAFREVKNSKPKDDQDHFDDFTEVH
ncbi:MAG: hypothetical protein EP333_08255 [Bacteroidetes bacterium]|nr:MAG: hypothetical protein EP333_08255 [Bacteroidota bacterium]TNE98566.1 MAG: hypothetical protein EP322_04685 [Bacteroidota bacterium]